MAEAIALPLLTHPANQVIDEISTQLRIGIRPFQRTRRQALIHRLLTDPKVYATSGTGGTLCE